MIYLFTGINGAGKTVNAIKFVLENPAFKMKSENGEEVSRPVYYFNIQDCTLPWSELTKEEVLAWWDLPKGSVIFVDEAYKVFPTRKGGDKVPAVVERLAEHRKDGYDFIFVCQKVVGQVDAFARGLVGCHIHLERVFNSNRVKWFEWQKCQDNVNDYHARKEAVSKTIKLPKSYFSAYKSAEIHTMKPRLPWAKLILILFGIGVCIFIVVWLASRVAGRADSDAVKGEASAGGASAALQGLQFGQSRGREPLTRDQYIKQMTPRIDGFPHTAPIYDEVTRPVTYPKLNCVQWDTGDKAGDCRCYTQQATLVSVPAAVCSDVVANGYFDPAKPDRQERERERVSVGSAPMRSARSDSI